MKKEEIKKKFRMSNCISKIWDGIYIWHIKHINEKYEWEKTITEEKDILTILGEIEKNKWGKLKELINKTSWGEVKVYMLNDFENKEDIAWSINWAWTWAGKVIITDGEIDSLYRLLESAIYRQDMFRGMFGQTIYNFLNRWMMFADIKRMVWTIKSEHQIDYWKIKQLPQEKPTQKKKEIEFKRYTLKNVSMNEFTRKDELKVELWYIQTNNLKDKEWNNEAKKYYFWGNVSWGQWGWEETDSVKALVMKLWRKASQSDWRLNLLVYQLYRLMTDFIDYLRE